MLVLLHAGQVLLEKRPGSGIWGGLWSLPEIGDGEDVAVLCKARFGARVGAAKALPTVAHGFTHFHLDIEPLRVTVQKVEARAASPGVMWLTSPTSARSTRSPDVHTPTSLRCEVIPQMGYQVCQG